jgi:DNA-binding NarL/FixJ family response regulator
VLLVEDHHLVRAAIGDTLRRHGLDVVGQAASAEEALAMLVDVRPDIVLVDIELPGMGGINLVRELVPRLPDGLVIMLSASDREEQVMASLRAGAAGYLTKDLSPEALVRTVKGAMDGDLPMPRRMAAGVVRELLASERRRRQAPTAPTTTLSEREREVMALVAAGLTDRAIGERLGISPRTVGHHLGRILSKLGVPTRAAAARAWKAGLVGTPDEPVPDAGTTPPALAVSGRTDGGT